MYCYLFVNKEIVDLILAKKKFTRIIKKTIAGWSSLVARRAHNPKVVGSNPAPATNHIFKYDIKRTLNCLVIEVFLYLFPI